MKKFGLYSLLVVSISLGNLQAGNVDLVTRMPETTIHNQTGREQQLEAIAGNTTFKVPIPPGLSKVQIPVNVTAVKVVDGPLVQLKMPLAKQPNLTIEDGGNIVHALISSGAHRASDLTPEKIIHLKAEKITSGEHPLVPLD